MIRVSARECRVHRLPEREVATMFVRPPSNREWVVVGMILAFEDQLRTSAMSGPSS